MDRERAVEYPEGEFGGINVLEAKRLKPREDVQAKLDDVALKALRRRDRRLATGERLSLASWGPIRRGSAGLAA